MGLWGLLILSTVLFTSLSAPHSLLPQEVPSILENPNIIIIDSRPCKCCYNNAHLENAIWCPIPDRYYNSTHDFLVYGSKNFCDNLSEHINGTVYYLENYTSLLIPTNQKLETPFISPITLISLLVLVAWRRG